MAMFEPKGFSENDQFMGGTTSGWYKVEYEVGVPFRFRAQMHLQGNWQYQTQNRYAMYLKVGGVSAFDNYTMKGWTSGFESLNTTTGWSEWKTINLSTSATSVGVECGVANTGSNTGWTNFQPGWPTTYTDTITFPALTGPTINSASVSGGLGTASYSCSASAGSSSSLSYSWNIGGKTASGTSGTITGLSQNKSYSWSLTVSDGNGMTATRSGTFTTTHTAPSIGTRTISHSRNATPSYDTTVAYSVSYSGGASYASHSLKYGTSSGSYNLTGTSITTGTSSSFKLSGLEPNKTYYYQITETDNGLTSTKSSTVSGSFTTPCLPPSAITQRSLGSDNSMIGISYTGEGDENAPITEWKIKYRKASETTSTTVSAGTSTSWWIDNLDADTDYKIDVIAINAGGESNSGEYNYATKMNQPTISSFTVSDLQPFSCKLTVVAASSPVSRTLNYRFSKDDGATWTNYQTGNTYQWTGLTEETLYKFQVQVKALTTTDFGSDTVATASAQATTLSDQARIRTKVDGAWKQGKAYYKLNGTWVKAKKVYIKKNGVWVINKNN